MTNRYRILLFVGLAAVLSAFGSVNAGIIAIPDSGFETPDVSADPIAYPYFCTTDAPSLLPWIGGGASIYDVALYSGAYGEGGLTNPIGDQSGYLGNQLAMRPFLYQTLPETYVEGNKYILDVAAALYQGGSAAITEGQILSLQLGYWSGDPDGAVGPTIVKEVQLGLGDLIEGTFLDFTVDTGTITGDAVGKNIVIYLSRADGTPAGRQYCVDNVRLTEVPEPGTIALLATGLLGFLACAWRKRK